MSKSKTTKTIKLSFELTQYLMSRPSISRRFVTDNFVVFSKNDEELNKNAEKIVQEMRENGKDVVMAYQKSISKNDWRFEIAT